jgi:Protein of unknown function (DUF2490)
MKSVAQRRRSAAALALFVAVNLMAWADASAVSNEIWPELDLSFPLREPLRLLLTGSGTRDSESGDKSQGTFAAYFDYRISQNISVRAGYEYLENLKLSTGAREGVEHRQVYDFNYYWHLGEDTQIADRTRVDVRDQAGRTTYRCRNRLLFTHELAIRRVRLIPYASAEAFYDTQYDQLNRLQFRLGTTLLFCPATRHVSYHQVRGCPRHYIEHQILGRQLLHARPERVTSVATEC